MCCYLDLDDGRQGLAQECKSKRLPEFMAGPNGAHVEHVPTAPVPMHARPCVSLAGSAGRGAAAVAGHHWRDGRHPGTGALPSARCVADGTRLGCSPPCARCNASHAVGARISRAQRITCPPDGGHPPGIIDGHRSYAGQRAAPRCKCTPARASRSPASQQGPRAPAPCCASRRALNTGYRIHQRSSPA